MLLSNLGDEARRQGDARVVLLDLSELVSLLLVLRHSVADGGSALLVVGTIVLMPGLGFIISAGITWVLARHLGLMPDRRTQD
jgi:hypothetical protein